MPRPPPPMEVLEDEEEPEVLEVAAPGEKACCLAAQEQPAASASCEVEFSAWLEEQLASERRALLARLQEDLFQRLARHHSTLFQAAAALEPEPWGGGNSYTLAGVATGTQELGGKTVQVDSNAEIMDSPKATAKSRDTSTESCSSSKQLEKYYKSPYIRRLSTYSKSVRPEISHPQLRRCVQSHAFELVTWFFIILNMFSISIETQWNGCKVGSSLSHQDRYDSCGFLLNRGSEAGFAAVAIFFCALFLFEFLLRLFVLGRRAVASLWMWFDFLVLAFGVVDAVSRLGPMVTIGVNPTALRTIRMAHMLRMVKVFRGRPSFQTLFLLMKSIMASRHALGWSLGILFCTMTSAGLVMSQFLYTYLDDKTVSEEARLEVYNYFGTYTRMLITMCEITLGNWAPPSRVLIDNISQWWGFIIVGYRLLFGFSLVQVTAAIFITETNRVAADDEVQMMRKQRADVKTARVLEEVFIEIDTSGDGLINLEELRAAMRDKLMQDLLQILEVDVHDMEELFQVMDPGTGEVPREDFITAILRLRGQAKTSKLVALMQMVRNLDTKFERFSADFSSVSKDARARLERAASARSACSLAAK